MMLWNRGEIAFKTVVVGCRHPLLPLNPGVGLLIRKNAPAYIQRIAPSVFPFAIKAAG